MKVYPSKQFQKSFKKLPKDIQQIAIMRDKVFRNNPHSPQLKTHKLKGRLSKFGLIQLNTATELFLNL